MRGRWECVLDAFASTPRLWIASLTITGERRPFGVEQPWWSTGYPDTRISTISSVPCFSSYNTSNEQKTSLCSSTRAGGGAHNPPHRHVAGLIHSLAGLCLGLSRAETQHRPAPSPLTLCTKQHLSGGCGVPRPLLPSPTTRRHGLLAAAPSMLITREKFLHAHILITAHVHNPADCIHPGADTHVSTRVL